MVAAQVYGKMKKNQDTKADDIDYLLRKYPNLRVAYIDETRGRDGRSNFYSVLIKASQEGGSGGRLLNASTRMPQFACARMSH